MKYDVQLVAAAAVALAFVGLRLVAGRQRRRDPRRLFNQRQRAVILARAGYRCEHSTLGFRCRRRGRLQADHIRAWAHGGRTSLDNGAALCAWHNRRWGARRKPRFYVWRMKRRRLTY